MSKTKKADAGGYAALAKDFSRAMLLLDEGERLMFCDYGGTDKWADEAVRWVQQIRRLQHPDEEVVTVASK